MSLNIHHGDALTVLRTLLDASVNCCVTSPPYYGLRDYGVDGQIGIEKTPAEYIARLVDVFREVRRVLADDGTLFVNVGDSYAATTKGSSGKGEKQVSNAGTILADRRWRVPNGLKPKDLIGIPWMLAFALRDDGWWLRQDIIWAKPNPMPESVKDRCTKAHEYIFMLSKSARYWWDAGAVSESAFQPLGQPALVSQKKQFALNQNKTGTLGTNYGPDTRNRRSVWTLATLPTPEAHFATYPIELPELCIRAGCPEGGVVLDPFTGAGTTALACLKNGRGFIGIELSAEYIEIAQSRARKYYPLLCEATA